MGSLAVSAIYSLSWLIIFSARFAAKADENVVAVKDCNVLVAGGSLAGVAAALASANVSRSLGIPLRTCLLEATDWPGGQFTSSLTPPDMGPENRYTEHLPSAFVKIIREVTGDQWLFNNPGHCWVSYKCFENVASVNIIKHALSSFGDQFLRVYYNSIVSNSELDSNAKARKLVGSGPEASPATHGRTGHPAVCSRW